MSRAGMISLVSVPLRLLNLRTDLVLMEIRSPGDALAQWEARLGLYMTCTCEREVLFLTRL